MGACLSTRAASVRAAPDSADPLTTAFRAALTAELARRRTEHGVASFNRMLLQFARLKVRGVVARPRRARPGRTLAP